MVDLCAAGFQFRLLAACSALWLCLGVPPAYARTALHLGGRIVVDGLTSEYSDSEQVFLNNVHLSPPAPEESHSDSRWQDNEVYQIKVTWDADSIYLAVDGVTNGNNMMLMVDVGNPAPGPLKNQGVRLDGLSTMTDLNAWRRNFIFDNGFSPDLVMATWDGNTTPHLETVQSQNRVLDESPADTSVGPGTFRSAATFSGTKPGSMEFALPWWKFFGYISPGEAVRVYVPALRDSVTRLPDGVRYIRFAAVVTGGGDGTGGPDSAPDNLSGHELDASVQETIDNYAILDLDSLHVNGSPGPDSLPDFGVEPKSRITFKIQPPVTALRLELNNLAFDRPWFAPGRGEKLKFTFDVSPFTATARSVRVSASVHDLRGRQVRTLFTNQNRPVGGGAAGTDTWDGLDDNGQPLPGGTYLVRLVLEPSQGRLVKAVVVAR